MQFVFFPRKLIVLLFSPVLQILPMGFSWSNLHLLIPELCLKESGNPETRRLQTHGSCSLPPNPSSQGEPLDPTQRSIHLPVRRPSFASSRSGVFFPRKKGQLSNWRSQELVSSLPANHRRCGEGHIPLPPYPASHSVSPSNKSLTARFFFP
ncbi:hypothetical protein AMECASPLE_034727 [Ameca splendens]|uniref:Secreted protein n=1 Tax=Ameca splendens TaxID=208324 RepID=A0ABV0YIW4_9TELE